VAKAAIVIVADAILMLLLIRHDRDVTMTQFFQCAAHGIFLNFVLRVPSIT
jgi:hypothetical protein